MSSVRPVVLTVAFIATLLLVLFLAFYVHSDDHTHNVRTTAPSRRNMHSRRA